MELIVKYLAIYPAIMCVFLHIMYVENKKHDQAWMFMIAVGVGYALLILS